MVSAFFTFLVAILVMVPAFAKKHSHQVDPNDAPFVYKTHEPQEMTVVSDGSLSLQKRLDMINNAKKSIEVEFFIYNIDQAGRLVTQALVRKAHEGVKVRVLVDYGFPIGKLDPFYATMLNQHGIEVRYYNPNLSFDLFKGQFRSHRKNLVVDDTYAVTGGRNIADEYFDLAKDYNFLDRDVFVKGTLAEAMRASFDRFWFSRMTKVPETMIEPKMSDYGLVEPISGGDQRGLLLRFKAKLQKYQIGTARALSYITESDTDRAIIAKVKTTSMASEARSHARICNDSIFAADMPGIGQKNRVLFEEIKDQASQAETSIDIETPYFVTSLDGIEILKGFMQKGVNISVYTNSLNSTDAIYTTAAFYPRVGILISAGLNVFIYRGKSLENKDYISQQVEEARWGIHAKSAVLDKKTIMVGTFNVDPRSRNINAEMAIMCRENPELARDVLDSMMERKGQSVQLNSNVQPVDGTSKFAGVSIPKRIEYILLTPLSNLLDFLL